MVKLFRIPNNWDGIGQALAEPKGGGQRATQLLEENNRAVEDAIAEVTRGVGNNGSAPAPGDDEGSFTFPVGTVSLPYSGDFDIPFPSPGRWEVAASFEAAFVGATGSPTGILYIDGDDDLIDRCGGVLPAAGPLIDAAALTRTIAGTGTTVHFGASGSSATANVTGNVRIIWVGPL